MVFEYAGAVLDELVKLNVDPNSASSEEYLTIARKQLCFWQKNADNNEKYLRQVLDAPLKSDQTEGRNLLGMQSSEDWIQNFNIGSTMHITPLSYEQCAFFGDLTFEISKNKLLEKVITALICDARAY